MTKDPLKVSTLDGKYTVVQTEDGSSTALRYGEPWPAYEGKSLSNLELALAYDLNEVLTLLKEFARQKKTLELETEYEVNNASFEDAHDIFIEKSRKLLRMKS